MLPILNDDNVPDVHHKPMLHPQIVDQPTAVVVVNGQSNEMEKKVISIRNCIEEKNQHGNQIGQQCDYIVEIYLWECST